VSDPILVGKLVAGRYRVVRRLGAGGMGTVYVAVQEPLGREVALKVVRREMSGDERAVQRFRREAMTLSQVHHPHIVALHDFGEFDGALYFAMELVRGETLRQRLQRTGPLPVKKSVALVREIASALAAAHPLGIIHRDLKPENILLMDAAGQPDFVKIVDFGVAKLVRDEDAGGSNQEALTQHGSVVGTPGYIAPEVALRGVTTDPRSDLYALGVVWFECLAGRQPFYAKTATALLMAHALDPVPSLPDEVPLPVAGLVQRLLAKGPEDRPSSAEELSALLDALPIIDSAAAIIRPNAAVPLAHAEASAATIDEIPRHSPQPEDRPRATPLTTSAPNAPTALSARGPAPPNEEVRTEVAFPTIASAPPEMPEHAEARAARRESRIRGERRSLLVAAALIAGAIVIAAVAMGLLLRQPATTTTVDAGTVVTTVDAGTARTAVVDAGSHASLVVDAGPSASKPPPTHTTKPPTHTTHTSKPPDDTTEHQPDLDDGPAKKRK
jgi:serine/threonine-protein kinase